MEINNNSYQTIGEYLELFSGEILERLIKLNEVIKEAAPGAIGKISYQMPTYFLKGNLVYFAAFKNHIGFFPTPSGVEAFKEELSGFKCTKGTIQLPNNKPLPYDLVRRIVEFRVAENIGKAEDKKKK